LTSSPHRDGAIAGSDGRRADAVVHTTGAAADLIAGDVLDTLLVEVCEEIADRRSPVPTARSPLGQPTHPRHAGDDGDASLGPQLVHIPSDVRSVEVEVGPFLDAALPLLGVAADSAAPVETPLRPPSQWLPAVVQGMREREGLPAAAQEAPEHDDPDSSAAQRDNIRERGTKSFAQLLADALVEIAEEEVKKAEPRGIGWRRRGLGEAPLSRFRAQQAAEGRAPLPKTWGAVRSRLEEAVKFGSRPEEHGAGTVTGTDEDQGGAPGFERTLAEDFDFDSMLEEEISADEPSWLNIGADFKSVKNQVANLLFEDLIEETIAQVRSVSVD